MSEMPLHRIFPTSHLVPNDISAVVNSSIDSGEIVLEFLAELLIDGGREGERSIEGRLNTSVLEGREDQRNERRDSR